jgi:hypothetical protein
MAQITQPGDPEPPPPRVQEPNGAGSETDEPERPDPDYVDDLEIETGVLLRMLKDEIGLRWMSIELRFQFEKVEVLIGERGTAPTF